MTGPDPLAAETCRIAGHEREDESGRCSRCGDWPRGRRTLLDRISFRLSRRG